ncbi:MAG: hypothetical protein WAO71_07690 [Gallionella sp.]
MERLVFLPVAFFLVILTYPFHLSYLAFGVLMGLGIIVFDFVRGKEESFEPPLGYLLVVLGLTCLAIAFYISNRYGITFEALDHDKTFPKFVRKLPYFGVALLTMGAVIVIKSFFRKR